MRKWVLLPALLHIGANALFAQVERPIRETVEHASIGQNVTGPESNAPQIDSAYLYAFPVRTGDRSWYTGQISRGVRSVEIRGVHRPADCEKRQVTFTQLTSVPATAAPPTITVQAVWFDTTQASRDRVKYLLPGPLRNAHPDPAVLAQRLRDTTRHHEPLLPDSACIATIYWRMGDSPGRNVLVARIVRSTAPDTQVPDFVAARGTATFKAIGHVPPGIIAGLAYQFGDRDRGGSKNDTTTRVRRRYEPILGIDFPLLIHRNEELLDHIRGMVATHYSDPGFDIYVGLEVLPIVGRGAREAANPFQISVGAKKRHSEGYAAFIAAHYNTTSLLNGFFSALGAK